MTKQVLGRGLRALLPEAPHAHAAYAEVEIGRLEANPHQPRTHFDPDALAELAASIKEHGLLQPLLVSEGAGGKYLILAGERRWRAAGEAGLERVPVVIREHVDDDAELELALVENIQRRDLTPLEEARAYRHLREERGLSQAQIAAKVGIDRSTVANALRLFKLPAEVQALVEEGRLSAGQARTLLAFGAEADRRAWAQRAADGGVSVRDLERAAAEGKRRGPAGAQPPTPPKPPDPNILAAQKRLSRKLGVKVEIKQKKSGAHIVLQCPTENEVQRVFDLLMGGE